jgi:hypothetical protein
VVLPLFLSDPLRPGVPTAVHHFQPSLFWPSIHYNSDHVAADIGAKTLHIGDTKRTGHVFQSVIDQVGFRTPSRSLALRAFLKLTVRCANRRKKVIEPGRDIVTAVVPPRRAPLQYFVVALLCLLNNSFETDVATDLMSMMVEGQQEVRLDSR